MGAVQGNCYENRPNDKWLKMNDIYVNQERSKIHTSHLDKKVVHTANIPSINAFEKNEKEGQEDIQTYGDGRVIAGIVKGGKIPRGTITYPNGDLYEGEIWRKTAHGMGSMKYKNGEIYSGRFYKDRKDGVGELITSNGKYNGNFRDGLFDGQGVFQFNDGSVYRGTILFKI